MMNLPKMIDRLPTDVVVTVTINCHANGALSVHGPIHDKPWMLAVLANAADAVRGHSGNPQIVVPEHDVSLPS